MKVTILGAGAYGLALALSCYRNKNEVTIWTKIESEKDELIKYRKNVKALPDVIIPDDIFVTTDLLDIQDSNLIIIAIPIPYLRNTCLEIKNYLKKDIPICIASKGIENETNSFAHKIIEDTLNTKNYSILSGPTFAVDLANNDYAGLTLATTDDNNYNLVSKILASDTLKLELNRDIIGVELCGSIKNVMAVLAGILDGIKVSETTKALFLTKAINEIKDLIINFGGLDDTILTFSGIGDLLLTCTSNKSRNYTLGTLLATKEKEEINSYIENTTVEGYFTLISIYNLIKKKNINSPLIELLYEIIFSNKDKKDLLTILCK